MTYITENSVGVISLASSTGRLEFVNVIGNLFISLSYLFFLSCQLDTWVDYFHVTAKMSLSISGLIFYPHSKLRGKFES